MTTPELEAVARAIYREFENRPLHAQAQMNGVIAEELARAALKAIREPSEGMVEAIWRDVQTVSDESRMLHLLADAEASHKAKAKRRWKAAVDHILGSDGE